MADSPIVLRSGRRLLPPPAKLTRGRGKRAHADVDAGADTDNTGTAAPAKRRRLAPTPSESPPLHPSSVPGQASQLATTATTTNINTTAAAAAANDPTTKSPTPTPTPSPPLSPLAAHRARLHDGGPGSLYAPTHAGVWASLQRARAVREMRARAAGLARGSNVSPPGWWCAALAAGKGGGGRVVAWKKDWVDGRVVRPREMLDDLIEGWGEPRRRRWVEGERRRRGLVVEEDGEEEEEEEEGEKEVRVKVEEGEDVVVKVED